jgi:spore maturation protein CgeB
MKIFRVLITGASPDQINRNTVLRSYVVEGFQQLLGIDNVFHCPLEYAATNTLEIKPDLVLSFGSCMPDDADYFALRYSCDKSGSLLAFWLHDDPYEFDYNYKVIDVADFIFSNDKWAALHYNHTRAYHLPLAASKFAHYKPLNNDKEIDIFFCGVAFQNRIRLITDLEKTLANYKTTILGDQWPKDLLPLAKNKRLTNNELSEAYARSKLTLNVGRDFHYANDRYSLVPSTPGPRTFEAAMAGTTQIYFVESLEIEEYYTPNKEIILFNSADEFEELVNSFIDGSLGAADIQMAAQERTINEHTYYSRAETMLKVIENCQSNYTSEKHE